MTNLTRTARPIALGFVALSLLAAACSSGAGDFPPISSPDETTATPAPTQALPSTSETTEPEVDNDPESAALDAWTTLLNAARSGAPDAGQLEIIRSLSDADTAEQLESFFPEAPTREITFHPQLTVQDDGTVSIDDCIIMNRGISTGASNWLIGTAAPTGPNGQWIIEDVKIVNLDPCVPRSIAKAAIEGYEAHWDARDSYFDPPDPDSSALRNTTTGDQLELFLQLIDQFQEAGQVVRGNRHTTVPEFSNLVSPTEVVIIDCQDTNPDYGVYDLATGERTDLIPPVADGQLDLRETTMVLEDDQWKVEDIQGQSNVQCRTPPTPVTLAEAGG